MEREASITLREDLAEVDLRSKKAEERVGLLEKESESAQARAAGEAVAKFRKSSEYRDDIAENCLEAFHLGFLECKGKVAKVFPALDLGAVREYDDDEEAGVGAEETEAGVETSEAVPTMEDVFGPSVDVVGADLESAPIDNQEGA